MKTILRWGVLTAMVVSLFLPGGVVPVQAENRFSCADITLIPQSECEALAAFYTATNGDAWQHIKRKWFATSAPNDWDGVALSNGHVIGIVLSEKNVNGFIPPEITRLRFLTRLELFRDTIASIPPELGELPDLEVLNLGSSHISGRIPAAIGNLSNLRDLSLGSNELWGSIPVELGNLRNLQRLSLGRNHLSGPIPVELGNLVLLENLWLGWNQLSGTIPEELGNLILLKEFSMGHNHLSGTIPAVLGGLNQIVWFDLSGNQLSGSIPLELCNLTNLRELLLDENQLSGSIPPGLGALSLLRNLRLGDNRLSGEVPPELGSMSSLRFLALNNNQFTGSIPPEMGNLTGLYHLSLRDNQLSGEIPATFVNLVNIDHSGAYAYNGTGLELGYNHLTVPEGYPVNFDPLDTFLFQKDRLWHLTQQVAVPVMAAEGGTLISLDSRTSLNIPGGAAGEDFILFYDPHTTAGHPSLNYSGMLNFSLQAETGGASLLPGFDLPVTVTLGYEEWQIGGGSQEERLHLYWWDEASGKWTDALNTCPSAGEYIYDRVNNQVTLTLCATGRFALLRETEQVYLPLFGY